MKMILCTLITLYLLFIYLFKMLRHYLGLFQSNQKMLPSVNQLPEVYRAILISYFILLMNRYTVGLKRVETICRGLVSPPPI